MCYGQKPFSQKIKFSKIRLCITINALCRDAFLLHGGVQLMGKMERLNKYAFRKASSCADLVDQHPKDNQL